MINYLRAFKNYLKHCLTWDRFFQKSWSQEGEDVVLYQLLPFDSGFYVDIGAHHPKRLSNTYRFYKKGWSGINIDAKPGSMNGFNKIRPRDINIEVPIAKEKSQKIYFEFEEPALNTLSEILSVKNVRPIKETVLDCYPLHEILDEYMGSQQEIDFMNIDVEGLDFEVLLSNDWKKYKPKVILIEILKTNIEQITNTEIYELLKEQNYQLYAKLVNTVFFIREDFLHEIYNRI